MNKRILCAAAAAALAQASHSADVGIYGAVDMFAAVNNDSGDVTSVLQSGGASASYVGIKGSEDLAPGVKAVFKLESGILADDGTYSQSFAGNTNRLFHRESWLGIQSDRFGQLSFGRQYTPQFLTWAMTDVTGLSLGMGASPFFFACRDGVLGGDDPTQDDLTRRSNSIFWASPDLGGATFMAYAALGEHGTSSTQGNVYSLAANYRSGGFFVMASVLRQDFAPANLTYAQGGRDYEGHATYFSLGTSYDAGFAKFALQLQYKDGAGYTAPTARRKAPTSSSRRSAPRRRLQAAGSTPPPPGCTTPTTAAWTARASACATTTRSRSAPSFTAASPPSLTRAAPSGRSRPAPTARCTSRCPNPATMRRCSSSACTAPSDRGGIALARLFSFSGRPGFGAKHRGGLFLVICPESGSCPQRAGAQKRSG
jgi:predicted porin